jgi:thioredoxin 1
MLTLTNDNFKKEIAKGWTVVDFWAPWCGPCKALGPVVDLLSEEMKGKVNFGKVNVDEQQELAEQFSVMSIPTLILFKDGEIAEQRVGAGTKEAIKSWVNSSMG